MPTNPDTDAVTGSGGTENYPAGQRLHCGKCGSEVEIINPCTCEPSDLVIRCCGQAMTPDTGRDTHLGVE